MPTPLRVTIDGCTIVRRQKCGSETNLALLNINLGGIFLNAELAHDGSLHFPRGISVPCIEEVEAAAQQAFLTALIEAWAERRKGGVR